MAAEKEPKSSEAEVPIQEALRFYERRCYYFFSGVIGITGCDPPVAFGPGVTPALLSVEPFELLVAVVSELVLAPFVGPLPASFAVAAPVPGELVQRQGGGASSGAWLGQMSGAAARCRSLTSRRPTSCRPARS